MSGRYHRGLNFYELLKLEGLLQDMKMYEMLSMYVLQRLDYRQLVVE